MKIQRLEPTRFLLCSALLVIAVLFPGCSSDESAPPRELGKVTGTVTLNKKPVSNVTVIFTPKEGGGASYALTDSEGKFVLRYTSGKLEGALVGVHTIALRDEGEESTPGGEALPGGESRIPEKYSPESTKTEKTVESGEQVIDITI